MLHGFVMSIEQVLLLLALHQLLQIFMKNHRDSQRTE